MFKGLSSDPAIIIYSIKRLEAYFIPMFWLLTDEKTLLFYKTKLAKQKRIFTIANS